MSIHPPSNIYISQFFQGSSGAPPIPHFHLRHPAYSTPLAGWRGAHNFMTFMDGVSWVVLVSWRFWKVLSPGRASGQWYLQFCPVLTMREPCNEEPSLIKHLSKVFQRKQIVKQAFHILPEDPEMTQGLQPHSLGFSALFPCQLFGQKQVTSP